MLFTRKIVITITLIINSDKGYVWFWTFLHVRSRNSTYSFHLKNMGTVQLCKVTVRDSKMERKCNMSLAMCIMKYGVLKHLQENMEASVLQTAVTPALVIILKHVITSFCLSPPVHFLSPIGLPQIKQAAH